MSYTNQLDHRDLDRHHIKDILMRIQGAEISISSDGKSREEQLDRLLRLCGSNLEKNWIRALESKNLHHPSDAQTLMADFGTRPDFIYKNKQAIIYVDGPPHDYADRQQRDTEQQTKLEDKGYTVIRFKHTDDWDSIFRQYPSIFGLIKD